MKAANQLDGIDFCIRVGVGVGAALGVLFAPRSGNDTRDLFAETAQEQLDGPSPPATKSTQRAQEVSTRSKAKCVKPLMSANAPIAKRKTRRHKPKRTRLGANQFQFDAKTSSSPFILALTMKTQTGAHDEGGCIRRRKFRK